MVVAIYFKVNEYEKHMLHKKLIYIVLIVSFIACSSKNPGMSKDEIVRTLDEQVMQHETAVKAASAAMPEVTEDYTPPAGIKYRAKIETAGVKTLNVQAALKNVRSMKVSELGTLRIHRTGALVPMGGSLMSVEEGYLLNGYQGIYLLDKGFKLIKQLFKNDVVFQALFTRGKEKITKDLLEKILKMKIHSIELDKSKDLLNDNKRDKNGRLDLRAVVNDNIECDIEVQLSIHEKMLPRFLLYWAKMYSANLQVGEKYEQLRRTISIIIVDKELPEFKAIKKAQTNWQIREEEYKSIILTSYFEIIIIELPKAIREYKTNKEDGALQWMMFLENPEDMEVTKIMEENENIKEAKEELDRISQDDVLRRMAFKAELERMDNEQMMYEARRDGKKEGIEQGAKEKELQIAKNMLKKGMNVSDIIEITGLTKEEVEKLV